MPATDAELLVRRYLRRLDDVAADARLPHTFRNELMGDVRKRVEVALDGHDPEDARAVRAVLQEMGTPDAMIAGGAGRVARAPLKPRPNTSATAAVLCGVLWLAGLGGVFAIIFGHRALAAIKLSDGRQYGERLALTATRFPCSSSSCSPGVPMRGPTAGVTRRLAVACIPLALCATSLIQRGSGPSTTSDWTRYVALGDSFVASPLTGVPVGRPVGCGRTQLNYPRQVADALHADEFVDRSCGGATVDQFFAPQLMPGGENPAQLDAVTANTTLVTIGVGGNDVGLLGWIAWCARVSLAQRTCVDQYLPGELDPLTRRIARLAPDIDRVLSAIHDRAPHARVVVVGYPAVIPSNDAGCYPQFPFGNPDVAYLRDSEVRLNSVIRNVAEWRGATFVDTYATSVGHGPCRISGIKWIEGLLPESPAASLHPNARGRDAIAADVLAAIDDPSAR